MSIRLLDRVPKTGFAPGSGSRSAAPGSMREVLTLFGTYREESGLESMLSGVDLEGVVPRQIYYAVHGRPPESIGTALSERDHAIANIFAAALRSGEFRQNAIRNILSAFPEKRRLLFMDIPSCGAPDLSRHLAGRLPALNSNIVNPDLVSEGEFFVAIQQLVHRLTDSQFIFVYGHVDLRTYEKWDALRLQDSLFTVLADPTDVVLAQVNHVLTRIAAQEFPPTADTLGWRQEFDVGGKDLTPGGFESVELARRVLRHRGVIAANPMSHFIGDGNAMSAVERIVTRDIEVTNIPNYSAWCRERWQFDGGVCEAKPYVYFDGSGLTAADRALIEEITNEDRLLYTLVADRLEEHVTTYLVGRDIVSPATPALATAEPAPARQPIGKAAIAIAPEDLMLCFESLGENCEFGLVQRQCGAEPLGLLRFSSSPLDKLMKALEARFDGMGTHNSIEVQISDNGKEYMVLDKNFGFLYHAWVDVNEKTAEQVHKREVSRVPFLVRKLIDDLTSAEKTFVFHGMQPLTDVEAQRLWQTLRQYGPISLLWVELATPECPAGSVDRLNDGFYKGYMDRFAPGENAHDLSLGCWLELCARVHAHRNSL